MVFTGARGQSTTPSTGSKGKLRPGPVPRSSSPKTAKKRSLGKLTVKEDTENSDVTETDSAKADTEEKVAELVTESQKPVRKQKLPRLNDNPDAPEVVDVPNMRSSHVERLSDSKTYENGGTGVNGDCDSDTEAPLDDTEPLKDSKVTLDDRMPPLIAGEDKCEAQPCAEDKRRESGGLDKSDSIVLIPLSDESGDVKGAGEKVTKEDTSAETKDELNGQGDEMLTNMIRENLNRAVSISNDSSNASSVDEMKQSLLNAIKDTLESSNSKPKSEDSSDVELSEDEKVAKEPLLFIKNGNKVTSQPLGKQTPSKDTKEEVVANGAMVNGDHKETENSGDESSELVERPGEVKKEEEEVAKTDKLEDDVAEGDPKTDHITNAEIEISSEPIEKNGLDSLAASGSGINDLIIEIQSTSNSLKEDSSKDIVPTEGLATITSLDKLDKGMLPVSSVQIEHVEDMEDMKVPVNLEVVDMPGISVVITEEEKPKLNIDKDKLFSQMNDIFAKDTHKALKNKPVYQKRGRPGKEDQVETKEQSHPAKKKKVKGIKKNKTNVEKSKEETLPLEKDTPVEDDCDSADS